MGRPRVHGCAVKGKETRTYRSWDAMKQRCFNPKASTFEYYGGKGITICEQWLGRNGFQQFLADLGERPLGKTLDRKDSDGNYEPMNCRWATPKEQTANRRLS